MNVSFTNYIKAKVLLTFFYKEINKKGYVMPWGTYTGIIITGFTLLLPFANSQALPKGRTLAILINLHNLRKNMHNFMKLCS